MMGIKQFMASKTASVLRLCACAALLVAGINYGFDAVARANAGRDTGGWWTQVSDTDGGAYTVRYALMNRDTILLRLYRTGGSEVLAERTYEEHGVAPVWTEDRLIYDTSGGDGMIDLPPTWLDWFLAKLP